MRTILQSFSLFYLLLIYGCSNSANEKVEKIDLSPNIYTFDYVYNPADTNYQEVYFRDILFLNEDCFLMIYNLKYDQCYIRGKYEVLENKIHLQFEKTAYSVHFPDVPATSAVDTNVYSPLVSERTSPFQKLNFALEKNKNRISFLKHDFEQIGQKNIDLTPENYRFGLMCQELQFLLDLKTISFSK